MRILPPLRGALFFGVATLGLQCTALAQTTCAQFASIPVAGGEYNIQTNEWNSSAQQCLTISGSSFTVSTANLSLPTNGPPATYPSIYKGCHWGTCTTGSNLPLQVSNIGSAISTWNTTPASGNWDTAYDVWFNQTATTNGQPNGAEIMIWINHQGPPQPAGSKVATTAIGGATWDVWIGNAGWNIVSYVRQQPVSSVSLDLTAFFNDAQARGQLQTAWWLIGIEAGFEIWDGGQGLASNSFTANVSTRSSGGAGGGPGSGAPSITSVSPATATPGTAVHVTGANFGNTQGASVVRFGSATGTVQSWSATSITAFVPGLPAGVANVTVTVGGATSNAAAFTVASPGGGAACHVTYSIVNSWPGGFQAALTINNTGSTAINGWRLAWNFGGSQQITNLWNASWTQNGQTVMAQNLSYNSGIAAGNSYGGIGFTANVPSGSNGVPSSFTLNGLSCN